MSPTPTPATPVPRAGPWHSSQFLTFRLLAVLMLILLLISGTLSWLARNSLSEARDRQLQNDQTHFAAQLQTLDRHWLLSAYAIRQQLELWQVDARDQSAEVRDARLRALLVTLLDQGDYVHAEIVDADGQRQFSYGTRLRGQPELPRQSTLSGLGWVHVEQEHSLFRTVSGAVRYAEQPCTLLLYVPMDNHLLGRLVFPGTALRLVDKGEELARATQMAPKALWRPAGPNATAASGAATTDPVPNDITRARLNMAWDTLPDAPELQIERSIDAPLTPRQLMVAGLLSSVLFISFGWLLLGRWLRSQTKRLTGLRRAAGQFAEDAVLSPALLAQLAQTARTPDDIGRLSEALRELMQRIERARQGQEELNASLEQRVAQRTEQLQAARDEALAAARAKEHFLSNMSHEIRTPMNGMLGALELLAGTPLTPAQNRYIEVASTSGAALLDIINDVLDYAKLGAGQMPLVDEPMDLPAVAQSVTTQFSAAAQRKQLTLELHIQPGLAGWRRGDALRLRQVLMNLVGNAMKFTQQGRIVVTLSADPRAAERVHFDVTDTGIGIDPSQHEAIFQPFIQAEHPSGRREGGTGLGLAICRQLVQAMGGELTVHSALGLGASFRFSLSLPPLHETMRQPPRLGPQAAPASPQRLRGRVLLVEDNPVNQLVGQAMLQTLGLTVLQADDGEQALQVLARETVDLVLLDCQMPVLDGYETAHRWRETERLQGRPRLPIIAFTANALSGDVARCFAAGMDGHLSKPFTQQQLAAALAAWLPAAPVDDQPSAQATPSA